MKIVKKVENSDSFIESDDGAFEELWKIWMEDHSQPCPIVRGHLMFDSRHYADYGVVEVRRAEVE